MTKFHVTSFNYYFHWFKAEFDTRHQTLVTALEYRGIIPQFFFLSHRRRLLLYIHVIYFRNTEVRLCFFIECSSTAEPKQRQYCLPELPYNLCSTMSHHSADNSRDSDVEWQEMMPDCQLASCCNQRNKMEDFPALRMFQGSMLCLAS